MVSSCCVLSLDDQRLAALTNVSGLIIFSWIFSLIMCSVMVACKGRTLVILDVCSLFPATKYGLGIHLADVSRDDYGIFLKVLISAALRLLAITKFS